MKLIKNKKFLVIFSSIILSLTLLFGVLIFILGYNKQNENTDDVNAAFTITDVESLTSNYASYSEFYISSLAGLKAFGESVESTNNVKQQSFEGKTVKLSANIDCGGQEICIGMSKTYGGGSSYVTSSPIFSGTFDGCGYTISNFSLGSSSIKLGGYSISGGASIQKARGLFIHVDGTIQNLKLKKCVTDLGATGGSGGHSITYQAALVGLLDGGLVNNCMVEGFSGAYCASGIIASCYSATVKNCYVSDIESENNMTAGIGPYLTKVNKNNSSTSFNNFSATITKCVSIDITISNLEYSSCYSSKTGDDFANLGTNLSKGGGTSGWYYYSGYNNGWPMLKRFISWQTVGFDDYNNAPFSINVDTLYIPEGLDAGKYDNSTSENLDFFGQSVYVSVNNCYNFSSWSWEPFTNNLYAGFYGVNVVNKTVKIKFANASNTTTSLTNLAIGTEYTISCGAHIIIEYEKYDKEGYKFITLTFEDSGGTERSITYTATNGYYIKESTLKSPTSNSDDYFYVHGHGDIPDLSNISVTTELKSYNITFQ